jgi:hypothetical protein
MQAQYSPLPPCKLEQTDTLLEDEPETVVQALLDDVYDDDDDDDDNTLLSVFATGDP